jgi:hypothetical protein
MQDLALAPSLSPGAKSPIRNSIEPKIWTLEKLLKAAARNNAVLDAQTKNRTDGLILARQRIYAGRLLPSQPKGAPVPDLRPEETSEAKAVAEQVVRFVLDWLGRNPPP